MEYNSYDIPDDERPVQQFIDPDEELSNKYLYNGSQILHFDTLKDEAIKIKREQENRWDNAGDSHNLTGMRDFILKHKTLIQSIMKEMKWLDVDHRNEWEYHMDWYYVIMQKFIQRCRYVISSYKKTNKKLYAKIKTKGDN